MSRSLDKWFRASMRVLLASVTVLMVVSAAMAQAQSNAGDLQGTVRDPNGAAVPNASITARNTGTNIAREATSNDDGYYKIVNLPPGNSQGTQALVFRQDLKLEDVSVKLLGALEVCNVEGAFQDSSAARHRFLLRFPEL